MRDLCACTSGADLADLLTPTLHVILCSYHIFCPNRSCLHPLVPHVYGSDLDCEQKLPNPWHFLFLLHHKRRVCLPARFCWQGSTQGHWRFPNRHLEEGHCYILTHPGTPAIFLDHLDDVKLADVIKQLIAVRKKAEIHARSKVYFRFMRGSLDSSAQSPQPCSFEVEAACSDR